ncbi:acyl-CoA dehydrogenase family protein [Ornithinimicrobium sufpigmenti]|uniref:acyl-CoA dehydrogenase family protein n=1 Tax=Ornithinimicrobium sufpigmenti TaxID=2508882 RepID=UPI00103616C2|nr:MULTISPECIES: acyl-CoA dehydrogenase family protein [unclassified Ornithinimicrobium]
MATHEVTNQPPPRVELDEYAENRPLTEAVAAFGADWATAHLHRVGRHVGSAPFQEDAAAAHRIPPTLRSHDRWGRRIDEVDYDAAYHRIIGAAVADGAHTSVWAEPRPGAAVARAATFMLYAQVEPGHACPVSMTHAAVPSLGHDVQLADRWLPRLLSRDYEPRLEPGKTSALFGMAMTEKQGGSDVRATTTRAVDAGDGSHRLTGHKWFCSAPMSDAFLVLAQEPRGLSCFLVPRVLEDGTRNAFAIQRLKDKVGNRSNASGEVELDQTVGFRVGEAGRGVRTIIDMVAHTRLDCVLGSAAGMRQSVAEAVWHARHRQAFGARLVDQPVMTAVLADLALESEAATWTALRLARAHDTDADGQERGFRRIATAVAKYWVCKRGPGHSVEAMECLGGNGYTEDFPLAMRYREQPVMAIWEGSGNVIALDVLRAIGRDPHSLTAFFEEVSAAGGAHPVLDAHLTRTRELSRAADPSTARRLVEALALALQASLMLQRAPSPVAEAFVGSRLDGQGGHLYGVLSPGADVAAILERA